MHLINLFSNTESNFAEFFSQYLLSIFEILKETLYSTKQSSRDTISLNFNKHLWESHQAIQIAVPYGHTYAIRREKETENLMRLCC